MKKMMMGFAIAASLLPIGLSAAFPDAAQAASTRRMICDASIAQANGNRLIYQTSGVVSIDGSGQVIPPPIGNRTSPFTLTVQRRDRNNKIKTLLDHTPIRPFEEIGPDADYSLLPFSSSFKGRPNDGREIYQAAASVHGIWVSHRPVNVAAQQKQIQVLHYLSNTTYLRSGPGTCRFSDD